jgi:hypothetical protein
MQDLVVCVGDEIVFDDRLCLTIMAIEGDVVTFTVNVSEYLQVDCQESHEDGNVSGGGSLQS